MAFVTGPSWAYKDVITSAKLAQMVENTRAHDHRNDGSQGSPLGRQTSPTWTSAAVAISTNTAMGSITIPTLARDSILLLMFQLTPPSATSTYGAVTPDYADTRVTNVGILRTGLTAPATGAVMMTSWFLAVSPGPAQGALSFTGSASPTGATARLFAYVYG